MKSKDLVSKEVTTTANHKIIALKILASTLVILSGLILFSDKVTTFGITETYGFKSTKTFIWVITQTISPLLLCFGAFLGAYRLSYFAPIYIYFIQLYWVFNARELGLDDGLLHIYALGFCITTFIALVFISFLIKQLSKTNRILLSNIQKLTRHIGIDIKRKYIKQEDRINYLEDTIEVIDSLE